MISMSAWCQTQMSQILTVSLRATSQRPSRCTTAETTWRRSDHRSVVAVRLLEMKAGLDNRGAKEHRAEQH